MSTGAQTDIISAEGVTKRFGGLVAVDRVDYRLRENEVAGIIGSNGAGKTTFFNLLTGYFQPDGGIIRYQGEDITRTYPASGRFTSGQQELYAIVAAASSARLRAAPPAQSGATCTGRRRS